MNSAARLIWSRSNMENARRLISPKETESPMLSSRNRSRICPMCWTFSLPSLRSERSSAPARQTLAAESTLRTW